MHASALSRILSLYLAVNLRRVLFADTSGLGGDKLNGSRPPAAGDQTAPAGAVWPPAAATFPTSVLFMFFDTFFIGDSPIRPTLIFQGVGVSPSLTQRGSRRNGKTFSGPPLEVEVLFHNKFYHDNDTFCKEGIIRSLNPNSSGVQDFFGEEICTQVQNDQIYLLLALIDSLSKVNNIDQGLFEKIYHVLSKNDTKLIRDSIANLAVKSIKPNEISTVFKLLTDPKFKIISDCIKESKRYLPSLDSAINSIAGQTTVQELIDYLSNSKNLQIISNSFVSGDINQKINHEDISMDKTKNIKSSNKRCFTKNRCWKCRTNN